MTVVRTSNVDLKVNGDHAYAFVAQPDDNARHPGVVLIQEWWGTLVVARGGVYPSLGENTGTTGGHKGPHSTHLHPYALHEDLAEW